jgi:hypothetical protein
MLVNALVAAKTVEADYGDPVDYLLDETANPPAWLVGNLLERLALEP